VRRERDAAHDRDDVQGWRPSATKRPPMRVVSVVYLTLIVAAIAFCAVGGLTHH
jgi:hypothetical protein